MVVVVAALLCSGLGWLPTAAGFKAFVVEGKATYKVSFLPGTSCRAASGERADEDLAPSSLDLTKCIRLSFAFYEVRVCACVSTCDWDATETSSGRDNPPTYLDVVVRQAYHGRLVGRHDVGRSQSRNMYGQ